VIAYNPEGVELTTVQPFQGWPKYIVFFVHGLHPWLLKVYALRTIPLNHSP